jgi:chitinase
MYKAFITLTNHFGPRRDRYLREHVESLVTTRNQNNCKFILKQAKFNPGDIHPMLLKLLFIFLQFGASLQASFSVGNENETIQILQKRQGPPGKHFVGYFIEWGIYDRDYQPSDIPGDKLTHINYAFANLEESGEVVLGDAYAATEKMYPGDTDGQPFKGALNQLLNVVRPTYPDLRVLLSIGGWTWSEKFSIVAADEGKRQTFAQSCKSIIDKFGFDGIDVDWEYPVEGGLPTNVYSPNDGANYVLLLQALRGAIGDKLITVAGPAGPHLTKHLDMSGMASVLDFINIMTYDFRGGWSQFTGNF